jgi:hypothetical protein
MFPRFLPSHKAFFRRMQNGTKKHGDIPAEIRTQSEITRKLWYVVN